MNKDLSDAFSKLNAQQKKAVELIDGPVLVIAGPGTGKTQLLNLRVANILAKTDTDPSQILCLTFTNAAATNMKERLFGLIGVSSRAVNIKTFHSFAAEIMSEYPDYFWSGARLSVVPEAVQKAIIDNILAGLPLDNPLASRFEDNFTATSDILSALRLTKEAGLTPEKLLALIEVNDRYIDLIEPELAEITSNQLSIKKLDDLEQKISQLPDQNIDDLVAPLSSLSAVIKSSLAVAVEEDKLTNKTTATSKWKARWTKNIGGKRVMYEERKRNQWWRHLAEVYSLYRNHLHQKGYYDYSDMLVEVLSTLEQQPELLTLVRERYLYILIDEFQDTNAAQLRLAHLVASAQDSQTTPNIMAVGDDDQSIFAFNGAELNNMLSFNKLYPSVKTIFLTENYRSNQAVLDAAASIISQTDNRLSVSRGFSKDLRAALDHPKGKIEHLIYPTKEHQLEFIAQRIKADREADSSRSIAVIARKHSSLKDISSYLLKYDVPLVYEKQNNILELELIQQIIILARLLSSIASGNKHEVNYNLSCLLFYPAWQTSPQLHWQLALSIDRQGSWLEALAQSGNDYFRQLYNWLLSLSSQSMTQPLGVVIEYMIGLRELEAFSSPLKAYYLDKRTIDNHYLANLSAISLLISHVHEFVATSHTTPSLSDFIDFITATPAITDSSWYIAHEEAVQLLTVHKAKGLEFDKVYIIDAIEKNWSPSSKGRKAPSNLPLQPIGEVYDDYVRMAYVAATRSRSSLIISSYMVDQTNNAVLPSSLFSAFSSHHIKKIEANHSAESLKTKLTWPRLEKADERLLLKRRLEDYSLSATGLIQYLDVSQGGPSQFLERQILNLPRPKTAYMAYGIAMHAAMQTAQNLVNHDRFDKGLIVQAYKLSLEEQQLPAIEFSKYLNHGKLMLDRLFDDYHLQLSFNDLSEVGISNVDIGPAIINGKIDHIHIDKKSLIITDYKTGKSLSSFQTKDKTKAIKVWRQRTQLLFYCLLVSQAKRLKNYSDISAQITYLEADNPKHLNLVLKPDPSELDRTRRLIEAVWLKIHSLDFNLNPSYQPTIDGIEAFEQDLLK